MTDIKKTKSEIYNFLTDVYLDLFDLEQKLYDSDSTENQRNALRKFEDSIRETQKVFYESN